MNLYSVYDNVAKEFGSPFLQQNNESATRSFKYMFNEKKEVSPSDFDLYLLGTFNIVTGSIEPLHDLVFRGVDLEA